MRYQQPEAPPPIQLSLPCQQPLYSDNVTREPPNTNDDSLKIFNPVGYIQEMAMKKKWPLPIYTTVSKEHVNGYTTFECTVQAMEITATGTVLYSGTSLLWTSLGQVKVWCPHFRGSFVQ